MVQRVLLAIQKHKNVSFIPVRELVSKKIIQTRKKCCTRTDLSTGEDTTGQPPNKKCLLRRIIGLLARANAVKCAPRAAAGGRPLVHCNHQFPPLYLSNSTPFFSYSLKLWHCAPYSAIGDKIVHTLYFTQMPCLLLVAAPLYSFLIDYCGSRLFFFFFLPYL